MRGIRQNNTKVLKSLVSIAPQCADIRPDADPFMIETGRDGSFCVGTLITSGAMKRYLPNAYIDGRVNLTAFDKAVMDAIYTIWTERENPEEDYCEMSYQEIYKVISGGGVIEINKSTKWKIKSAVYKLTMIMCIIDISSDLPEAVKKMRLTKCFKEDESEVIIEGTLIQTEFVTVKNANLTVSEGIRLLKCPMLYEYASTMDQIIWVEEKWLRLPFYLSDKIIGLRDYLISYIRSYDYKRATNSSWVGYKTIFEGAGWQWGELKSTQCKNRKIVNEILKHYIDAKVIKSFEISEDNRNIRITPMKKKK